jgi:uncharacterized protein YaeQ
MALSASIYKVNLTLSNFNTHFYHDFSLTLAKHPSESEERMMNRLAAFCYCAHPDLAFTRGLSTQDEPELWLKDLSGAIVHWIELGQPDEKRIKQAAGKSKKVTVFTTHPNTSETWFEKIKSKVPLDKVEVFQICLVENGPIDKFVQRSMELSCTIEDNLIFLGNENERVGLEFKRMLF